MTNQPSTTDARLKKMAESDSADLKKNMSLPRLAQLRVARFFIRKMCPSSECEDASYLEQAAREWEACGRDTI